MADARAALEDVRVLDLSDRLSAAFAAKLLGDGGADVALVEGPEGHRVRREAPFLDDDPGPERSLVHAYANLNKRSVVLEPSDERRTELMRRADVIVVSDRATAEVARAAAGRTAIILGVSPYGLEGPMADLPGNDLTAFAATGWGLMNGDEGAPPLSGVHNSASYLAGAIAFTGAVSALVARDRGGEPQTVDVSEIEPLVWLNAPSVLSSSYGDEARMRGRPGVFSGPVEVRDGYFSVTFSRPHFWTEALKALGLDEAAENPEYLGFESRRQHADVLEPMLEERLKRRDRWDLFNDLANRRCTVGVVLDMSDLASSEQLRGRDIIQSTTIAGRTVNTLAAPCRMSATPWRARLPAPGLGEHTAEVLAQWLGAGVGARR